MEKTLAKHGERYTLDGEIPEDLNLSQIRDLLGQLFGAPPRYAEMKDLVETGEIETTWHPYKPKNKFGNRRYSWSKVRSVMEARRAAR